LAYSAKILVSDCAVIAFRLFILRERILIALSSITSLQSQITPRLLSHHGLFQFVPFFNLFRIDLERRYSSLSLSAALRKVAAIATPDPDSQTPITTNCQTLILLARRISIPKDQTTIHKHQEIVGRRPPVSRRKISQWAPLQPNATFASKIFVN
jgi:hypothetical protein